MLKYIFAFFIILLFGACSVVKPHMVEYRIDLKIPKKAIVQGKCSDKSLKISQAFSANFLMVRNMNYALGEYKQDVYTQSQWAESPNRAITYQILKIFQDSNIFKSVQIFKSRSKNDFILETNIEKFMQYFTNDGKKSFGLVTINMSIIDTISNRVYATKTFSSKIDSLTLDSDGGVVALNTALSNVLTKQQTYIGNFCK